MSLWLQGIGVARGIAIGRVAKISGTDLEIREYNIETDEIDAEIARYETAHERAKGQLREVRAQIPAGTPQDIAAFIDTHLLMLDDSSLSEAVIGRIKDEKCNAEGALRRARDTLMAVFEQMDDPYLRTRQNDVEHVVARVLRNLLQSERALHEQPASAEGEEARIVVADDVTPADIILLAQQKTAAFVTEYGGPLSHTAILARSLHLPAIVGVHNARRLLREGEQIVVDGAAGHLYASPDEAALTRFRHRIARDHRYQRRLERLKDEPPVSRDGVRIRMLANIELSEDAAEAARVGADGVGLYRTEFLFMNRRELPTEQEQYEAYSRVVEAVTGPITIRTLDLGADKQVDSGARAGPTPNNPALGLRAIRLCLREPELFRTQIRALLRASVHGQMQIMLPMISNTIELRQARRIIDGCRAELLAEGVAVAEDIPIGVMIEVPAAAISAPWLARACDFFSIGTNDLIQYTLAIDRVDDEVNYLYDPLHPAVLSLIRQTIAAGDAAGIPVAMCGEMAGEVRFTRLLLGLGLTEFSMHPSSMLEVKRLVMDADIGALRERMQRALDATDLTEQKSRLAELEAQ